MTISVVTPPVYLAGGQSGNPAGLSDPGQLELAYQNLLSEAADVVGGVKPTVLVLSSGAITTASTVSVGTTETAAEVTHNLAVLKNIADFCSLNHISVMVEADLTSPYTWSEGAGKGHNELVDQWAPVAAAVGLPITKVEDVQEIATACPQSSFASFAAGEANAVNTLIQDYASSSDKMTAANLAVGDMEGGPPNMDMTTLSAYWDAYNIAATAAGVPKFSFTTADTGWFGPWIGPLSQSSWHGYLTALSKAAAADHLSLNVLVQGAETSTSANQFVQQAEQNAAGLAALVASGAVTVGSIMVQSWQQQPVSVDMITSPTSSTNEAAEIEAVYPLYASGLITAQGSPSFSSPGVILLNTGSANRICPLSVTWDRPDVLAGGRLSVVIIDQTGSLTSTQHGSGTVSNLAKNILILDGNTADLVAELNAVTLTEAAAGADTLDIESYGASGRISDNQVSVLAAAVGQSVSGIRQTANSQGWLSTSATLNTGTTMNATSKLLTETLTWSTTGTVANPAPGQSAYIQTVSVHEPLAEYGVELASSSILGTSFNAVADNFDGNVDDGVFPANGYANNPGVNNVSVGPLASWLPSSFDPAAQLTPLIVQSTTKTFDPNSGQLEQSVNTLAPDPLTIVDRTGTHPDSFATAFNTGGRQVVEFNTGGNAAWLPAWGNQFSSATSTYSGDGHLMELFLQGGTANPLFTIDYVFNPNNAALWEVFQSTTPPPKAAGSAFYANTTNLYQAGFATGPLYVTEFNTGDNPNWDYLDWKSAIASDTEVWTDNFIMANNNGFAESPPAAYPSEFVNGSTLDLMYLPGTINIDLNRLAIITISSQTMTSMLQGLNGVDAAGATGTVLITGSLSGGNTLIGGDNRSTITGYGNDTIIAGAGLTVVNTGSGYSHIKIASKTGATTVNGNWDIISAVPGSNVVLFGDHNTVSVSAGGTITETGSAEVLTFLGAGTLNQRGSNSSATVQANGVTVWMNPVGGSVTLTGNHNWVTGGTNSIISLIGSSDVIGAGRGTVVNVSGSQSIVYGSYLSVSAGSANTTDLTIYGDHDVVKAVDGSTVTVIGSGNTLIGNSLHVRTTAAAAGTLVRGGTLEITSSGTANLNAADTNLQVILDGPVHLNLGTLGFITASDAASGHDTIVSGGQNQTLKSIGGHDTLIGSSVFGVTFIGSSACDEALRKCIAWRVERLFVEVERAGLTGDTILNFGGSDVIDITDLNFAKLKSLSFNTHSAILTATDTTRSIGLAMSNNYQSTNFAAASDGHGGTFIRFV